MFCFHLCRDEFLDHKMAAKCSQGIVQSCVICGLLGNFDKSDSETDVIEKIVKTADAVFVPWKDQPIKCDKLDCQELWTKFDSFFDKDWDSKDASFVNLSCDKPGPSDPANTLEAEKKKKAEEAEHTVCDSIRYQLVL